MPDDTHDHFFDRARSIQELADYMDITPRFIHKEIERGNLRSRRKSINLVRLLPEDIRAWLDEDTPKRVVTRKKELATLAEGSK